MSAATGSFTEIVHVRLLGESVDVWRPVLARRLADDAYELSSDPVPDEETWEFAPGEYVRVQKRLLSKGAEKVASSVAVGRFPAHRISAE